MVGPDRPNALLETPRRSLLSRCGCSVFRRVEGGGWAVLTCCRCVRFEFWRSFFGGFFWIDMCWYWHCWDFLSYTRTSKFDLLGKLPWLRCGRGQGTLPSYHGVGFQPFFAQILSSISNMTCTALVGSKQGFFRLLMSPPIYQQNCGFMGDVHEERQVWHVAPRHGLDHPWSASTNPGDWG
jgi:hypothetical protein